MSTRSDTLLDASWLRALAREAGADDVGFVALDRPELDDQRDDILQAFPAARALISFVVRTNRSPIRSPARSIANLEFHHTGERVDAVASAIVRALEERGVEAINPAMGFPMEMDRFPAKLWVVSHKPVAEAAGLGRMGIHRNLIHPRFGNFVLLGTVVVAAGVDEASRPIDFQPCLECKLCVAACPVGAIDADGSFQFDACYTHNYREFMGGFDDWVETVVDSSSVKEYRERVSLPETVSVWQSLGYGPNYKSAYCMAVCPAGEEVLAPFETDRRAYLESVVRPLQEKEEPVYVGAGTDAEAHVRKRYPHKTPRRVRNGLRPQSIRGFLEGLPLVFQHKQAEGERHRLHFRFTGAEDAEATVTIAGRELRIEPGHRGTPDVEVRADARWWLGFLARERSLVGGLLTRKLRLRGSLRSLRTFARLCPPG